MNRSQRRTQGVKTKPKTYTLTDEQIAKIREDERGKCLDTAFILMMAIPVTVMHDKNGWGSKRLERFTDQVLDLYEAFDQGYVTFEDLTNTLEAETGIKLSHTKDKR